MEQSQKIDLSQPKTPEIPPPVPSYLEKLLPEGVSTRAVTTLAAALLVIVCGNAVYTALYDNNRFLPHTVVGEILVSGMTREEAHEKIVPALAIYKSYGIAIAAEHAEGMQVVRVPEKIDGFQSDTVIHYFSIGDVDAVLDQAYARGREGGFLNRVFSRIASTFTTTTYEIPVTVHGEALRSLLEKELAPMIQAPQNAFFEEHEGSIRSAGGTPGVSIPDAEALSKAVRIMIAKGEPYATLSLPLVEVEPAVSHADLEPLLPFVQALKDNVSFVLTHDRQKWTLDHATLITLIAPARGGTTDTSVTLAPEAIHALTASLATALSKNETSEDDRTILTITDSTLEKLVAIPVERELVRGVREGRFAVKDGQIVVVEEGQPGIAVHTEQLARDIEDNLRDVLSRFMEGTLKDDTVVSINLTTIERQPRLTADVLSRYGIHDLLGEARTSFEGSSEERIKNIETGVAQFNGTLIAPNQEFSLVEAIGDVTEEKGYSKEFVIKGDESVMELGGGLCQIATTVFRSVLSSGLPVTERRNHSYVVGYYGPGIDATIYGPHPDLRFVNDTGSYILVQTTVEGSELIVQFFGVKDGRMAEVGTPRVLETKDPEDTLYIPTFELPRGEVFCTEKKRQGMKTEVDYKVRYPNGEVKDTLFESTYTPWREKCFLGLSA